MTIYTPYQNLVTPEQFGAVSGSGDDGVAFATMFTYLASASPNKRTVLLMGDYNLSADTTFPDGITIYGRGKLTIAATFRIVFGADSIIRDITIDGGSASGGSLGSIYVEGDNTTLDNITVTNSAGGGIFVAASDNVRLHNCTIKDCNNSGIYVIQDTDNLSINECYINNCASENDIDCGIKVSAQFAGSFNMRNTKVTNNKIINCGGLGIECYVDDENLLVQGNVVDGANSRDILTGTVSGTSGFSALTGVGTVFNTELNPGDIIFIDGNNYTIDVVTDDTNITILDTFNTTFSGEDIYLEQGTIGISIVSATKGAVIDSNIVNANGFICDFGIEIFDSKGAIISNNTLTGCDIGISFNNVPTSTHCIVTGNTLIDCINEGVRVYGDDNIVSNNNVSDCGGVCFLIFGGDGNIVENNKGNSIFAGASVTGLSNGGTNSIARFNTFNTINSIPSSISGTVGDIMLLGNNINQPVLEQGTLIISYEDGGLETVPVNSGDLEDIKGSLNSNGLLTRTYLMFDEASGAATKKIVLKYLVDNVVSPAESDITPGIVSIKWAGRLNNASQGGTVDMYRHSLNDTDAEFVSVQSGTTVTITAVADDVNDYPFWEVQFPTNGRTIIYVEVTGPMANSTQWRIYYDE